MASIRHRRPVTISSVLVPSSWRPRGQPLCISDGNEPKIFGSDSSSVKDDSVSVRFGYFIDEIRNKFPWCSSVSDSMYLQVPDKGHKCG